MVLIEAIHTFAALALACGVVGTLLPEGALKKTAALVMGLLLTLCWADTLSSWLNWPLPSTQPETVLSSAQADVNDRSAALSAYERLLSAQASEASGASVQVELNSDGSVARVLLPVGCDQDTLLRACRAVDADPSLAVESTAVR